MPWAALDDGGNITSLFAWRQAFPTQFLTDEDSRVVAFRAPKPPTIISAGAFLARFTSAEEIAVQTAAQANPSIALGLTMGLAKGAINLTGDPLVTNWMQSLVTAGAITQARMTAILTP